MALTVPMHAFEATNGKAACTRNTGFGTPCGQLYDARVHRICRNCRKEIFLTRSDGWYHRGNASTSCNPGNTSRRAER